MSTTGNGRSWVRSQSAIYQSRQKGYTYTTVQLGLFFFYFKFPTHPRGADCFTHCRHTHKVHSSDSPHCSSTQSSSETLPVFSLQCFHRNGWNHSGVRNFNPFHSVLLPTGMGGKLKKTLELYCSCSSLGTQTYRLKLGLVDPVSG